MSHTGLLQGFEIQCNTVWSEKSLPFRTAVGVCLRLKENISTLWSFQSVYLKLTRIIVFSMYHINMSKSIVLYVNNVDVTITTLSMKDQGLRNTDFINEVILKGRHAFSSSNPMAICYLLKRYVKTVVNTWVVLKFRTRVFLIENWINIGELTL